MIKKIIPLGLFCNNHVIGKSGWIRDIQVCAKTLQSTKELKLPMAGSNKGRGMSLVALGLSAKHNPDGTKRSKRVPRKAKVQITNVKGVSPNRKVGKRVEAVIKKKKRGGQQTLGDVIEI